MMLEHAEQALEARERPLDPGEAEGQAKARDRAIRAMRQPCAKRPDHKKLADRQLRDIEVFRSVFQALISARLKRWSPQSPPLP